MARGSKGGRRSISETAIALVVGLLIWFSVAAILPNVAGFNGTIVATLVQVVVPILLVIGEVYYLMK